MPAHCRCACSASAGSRAGRHGTGRLCADGRSIDGPSSRASRAWGANGGSAREGARGGPNAPSAGPLAAAAAACDGQQRGGAEQRARARGCLRRGCGRACGGARDINRAQVARTLSAPGDCSARQAGPHWGSVLQEREWPRSAACWAGTALQHGQDPSDALAAQSEIRCRSRGVATWVRLSFERLCRGLLRLGHDRSPGRT